MQIHHEKWHERNFECGMCNFKAKDRESLNVHLSTCEIYECTKCEYVALKLSEIKKHIQETDECSSSTIYHVKLDRLDENKTSYKEYEQQEIFSILPKFASNF